MPIATATDVVSLDAAKLRVRVTESAFDTELQGMIATALAKVEHVVGCSIVERTRTERFYTPLPSTFPVRLSYRGLLLLPEVAEDTTATPPVAARAARNVTMRYYAEGDDVGAAAPQSLVLGHTARVEYDEATVPAAAPLPLRFGRAWVWPPAAGWPDRALGTPYSLEYSTGAPSADAVPEAWKDAALEIVRALYDKEEGNYEGAMRLLMPWWRY